MMKCRDLHRLLADWARDRLPDETRQRVDEHIAACRSCAQEAELERSLRASFSVAPPISQTPDLWERIETRIETVKRPRFVFGFQRAFALGGALAAGVLLTLVALPRTSIDPGKDRVLVQHVTPSEPGVLEKINTIRMTETDPIASYGETPSGDAAHLLLVGGPGH